MKRVLLVIAGCLALLVLSAAVLAGYAWLRAPGIVAATWRHSPERLLPRSLSRDQLHVLLTVEDPAFYRHHGVDLSTPGAGMTTITQGLVKYLYFKHFRPGLAKFPQSLFAVGFNARISKDEQLALFLNTAYFGSSGGRDVKGFSDAAQTYFGVPFEKLSRGQFLQLVAMCVGPNHFSVSAHPAANRERVNRIERLLAGKCAPRGLLDVYYADCAAAPPQAR